MLTQNDTVQAIKDSYHKFVAKLTEELFGAGEATEEKMGEFSEKCKNAFETHQRAIAAVGTGEGAAESDDDYRKRFIDIAGSPQHRQAIEMAKGPELDKLGEHYNVKRNAQPTPRPAQPKDEADVAEKAASRNLDPESDKAPGAVAK